MTLLRLIIAVLATYRLARFLPRDEGPFFVFVHLRSYIVEKYLEEEELKKGDDLTCLNRLQLYLKFWESVNSGSECPYCCGLYAAIVVAILFSRQSKTGDLILLILGIAGGQSLLQEWSDKR